MSEHLQNLPPKPFADTIYSHRILKLIETFSPQSHDGCFCSVGLQPSLPLWQIFVVTPGHDFTGALFPPTSSGMLLSFHWREFGDLTLQWGSFIGHWYVPAH